MEHITDKELEDCHADPAITRQLGMLVASGEIELATAVAWLEDDVLTRQDEARREG